MRGWLLGTAIAMLAGSVEARVLMGVDEAVRKAFPEPAKIEKVRVFLSKEEAEAVRRKWRVPVESRMILYYKGVRDGKPLGFAGIDTHVLRTRSETILVVIDPAGALKYVEVLNFFEPFDYFPPSSWFDLFKNPADWRELLIGRELPNVTGATITARELAQGVRRLLAVFEYALKDKSP